MYFLEDSNHSQSLRSVQIRKFIIDGSGVFPKTLFNTDFSYTFNPYIFKSGENYKEEVNNLIKLFADMGHEVFIRDVSFLGFPSYYVFIPNVSIFGRKTYEDASNTMTLLDTIEQDTIEDLFFPTSHFIDDKSIIKKLLDAIAPNREDSFKDIMMQEVLKLKFDPYFYWSNIPVSFFLTLFCFVVGEYSNAKKYLKLYIEETGNEEDDYYLKILLYFDLLEKGDSENILNEIPDDILQDFSSTKELFSHIALPNCPNCNNCVLKDNCQTRPNFNIALKLINKMNRKLSQSDLRVLFES